MSRPSRIALISLAALLVAGLCLCLVWSARYRWWNEYRKGLDLSLSEAYESLGRPLPGNEAFLALSVLSSERRWSEMEEYFDDSDKSILMSYYRNLHNAACGSLSQHLMEFYQPFSLGLFLPVGDKSSKFEIIASGDVWFFLGDMTLAEHSTILGMIFSPGHSGKRFLKRLAEINLINGDDEAAMKYIRLLRKDPSTREWAAAHTPGRLSPEVSSWIDYKRSFVPVRDTLRSSGDVRASLLNLLDANPSNFAAREYLLCYDLLVKDLDSFYRDYDPGLSHACVYDEAILIYLASHGLIGDESVDYYGITQAVGQDFSDFTKAYSECGGKSAPLAQRFGKTYWFFYQFAIKNEKK